MMLSVNGLDVFYGNVQALRDISIQVERGEIVTLIGANGAGKTTLLMTLSGICQPKSGSIRFLGSNIDGMKPHQIVKLGLTQVSQSRNLFPDLTVLDNLEMGAYTLPKSESMEERLEQMYGYFDILHKRRNQRAALLSGGEQQMLAFARALISNPKMLLLDEPSEGLAPKIVQQLLRIIQKLREETKLTILIVEQNAVLALELAERGYVLETGSIVASGTTAELSNSQMVKKAYLGI
jgi:branched-chain amino acid transport system ATP-binding protein